MLVFSITIGTIMFEVCFAIQTLYSRYTTCRNIWYSRVVQSNVLPEYAYDYPEALIAHEPLVPRDSARLLTYDRMRGTLDDRHFTDLPDLLPQGAVLVFNETKVFPARIAGVTVNGAPVELTVTKIHDGEVEGLVTKSLRIGTEVVFHGRTFTVLTRKERETKYKTDMSAVDFRTFLETYGHAPLPPYIHTPLTETEVREKYQTVFAKHEGSVAAPTASLHFTDALCAALKERGVSIEYVTLHVGLGTFSPVFPEQLETGELHPEEFYIAPDVAARLTEAKKSGRPVIAVGTTVARTLESASDEHGVLKTLRGATTLFIRPGYTFRFVDALATNFHVPQSSLLMLVDTFLGGKGIWRRLYAHAIAEKYRLFSFGDGMLIT